MSCAWCHGSGSYEAVEWPDGLISAPPPTWPGATFAMDCDHGRELREREQMGREEAEARRQSAPTAGPRPKAPQLALPL